MADIKISQLNTATTTSQLDTFMIVQNGTNKKLTLQTLLSNLNTDVTINSGLQGIDFCVNGLNKSNLFYTNASLNAVGIGTSEPTSTLQVIGNVRIGEEKNVNRTIVGVAVGAAVGSYKDVTITISATEDSITGIFNVDDIVHVNEIRDINNLLISALNGFKKIGQGNDHSFKYKIPMEVDTLEIDGWIEDPDNLGGYILDVDQIGAYAAKKLYKPGVLISSVEQIAHTEDAGSKFIDASYETTGLNIIGDCRFALVETAITGQEKKIFLKNADSASDSAVIENINGLNFNTITITTVGDSVTLKFENDAWVCLSVYGAVLTIE